MTDRLDEIEKASYAKGQGAILNNDDYVWLIKTIKNQMAVIETKHTLSVSLIKDNQSQAQTIKELKEALEWIADKNTEMMKKLQDGLSLLEIKPNKH